MASERAKLVVKLEECRATLTAVSKEIELVEEKLQDKSTTSADSGEQTAKPKKNCQYCDRFRRKISFEGYCFARSPKMASWLDLTEEDLEDAKRTGRLSCNVDTYGPAPASLAGASDPQRRLIMYLKVYRKAYGIEQRGVRVEHPICVVARIRRLWPGQRSAQMDEHEDNALDGSKDRFVPPVTCM